MTRNSSHERASRGAQLRSWFQRIFFVITVRGDALSTPTFTSLLREARWEGGGAEGGWLNMAEPLGHQGPPAGEPRSAWIAVEWTVLLEVGGWQVTRGRECRRDSTRILPSTYPRWVSSSRFPQMCHVTATASACGGLSSPPPWSLSLGVSSSSSCGELLNICGLCAATGTPRRYARAFHKPPPPHPREIAFSFFFQGFCATACPGWFMK